MSFYYWDETWVGSGVGTKEQPLEGDGQKFGPASGSACLAQSRKYMFGPSNRPAHASKSPNRPCPVKTPIFYFRLWLLALNGKTPVAISQIYHVFPHYKFQNQTKSKPSLCYVLGLCSWAVYSRRESRASSFSGKWLSPNSLYFFSLISFCDFLYSVNLELEFQVHKLLEEIVNGGATDPFACFALGDWTSSQHSVSYCAGMGFASGWFSGKLKGKVKFPVWLFRVVHAVCGLWGKEEND